MNKIKPNLKLKLVALFMITNMCSFMLGIDMVEQEELDLPETKLRLERKGYSEIVIAANLKTEINTSKPVALIHKESKLYIPYVFIIKKVVRSEQNSFDLDSLEQKEKYLVQVQDKYIKSILKYRDFNIVPQLSKDLLINSHRGSHYEINI